jgi:hypothetical protein
MPLRFLEDYLKYKDMLWGEEYVVDRRMSFGIDFQIAL